MLSTKNLDKYYIKILKYFLKNNEKVSGTVTHRTLWACGHRSTAAQVPKSKPATLQCLPWVFTLMRLKKATDEVALSSRQRGPMGTQGNIKLPDLELLNLTSIKLGY